MYHVLQSENADPPSFRELMEQVIEQLVSNLLIGTAFFYFKYLPFVAFL